MPAGTARERRNIHPQPPSVQFRAELAPKLDAISPVVVFAIFDPKPYPPPFFSAVLHDSRYTRKPPPAAGREAIRAALAEVRAVYAELDRRPVERQCIRRTECCQFKRTGLVPSVTRGEALLAAHALRASGRKEAPPSVQGACPMLEARTGKCLIYADRPFGCRTHFCAAAGGPYARREVLDLIRRLEAVDEQLGNHDGPKGLPAALAAVGV